MSATRRLATEGPDPSPYKVQVLDRAVSILELLANSGSEMSLGQLTAAIGLHKSTVHRLLMVMEAHSLIDKNPVNGRYRLGLRLFELGSRAVANLKVRDRARPCLDWVVARTSESAYLCVFDRGEMLCIDRSEPERSLHILSPVGQRFSVHDSAVGKAVMSMLPEAQVRSILEVTDMVRHTPNTLTTAEDYMAEMERTRKRGYAVDNEEWEAGTFCVAVPILNAKQYPVAAVGILAPKARSTAERIEFYVESLRHVASELSAALEDCSQNS